MTKSQLIELLSARHSQLAPKDAELAVKTMLDAMSQTLATGNRIEIRGFGSSIVAPSGSAFGSLPGKRSS